MSTCRRVSYYETLESQLVPGICSSAECARPNLLTAAFEATPASITLQLASQLGEAVKRCSELHESSFTPGAVQVGAEDVVDVPMDRSEVHVR